MNWAGRVLIVAPHPDDEVIGCGGQFPRMRDPWFVHVTDGAPQDMRDALACGFERREDYARARRQESLEALQLAGIGEERSLVLGFGDQQAAFHLPELACRLAALFQDLRPDVVLTPAYEGGHPDHDSTAFAVHAAIGMVDRPPLPVEYALYHSRAGRFEAGTFLDNGGGVETVACGGDACELKRRMLACFRTQRNTLSQFTVGTECFRPAPAYDFGAPPHEGRLYYEQFPWGVSGEQWRELARQAALKTRQVALESSCR